VHNKSLPKARIFCDALAWSLKNRKHGSFYTCSRVWPIQGRVVATRPYSFLSILKNVSTSSGLAVRVIKKTIKANAPGSIKKINLGPINNNIKMLLLKMIMNFEYAFLN